MKVNTQKLTTFLKTHKMLLLNIVILAILLAVPTYSHFANRSLTRMQADSDSKLSQQTEQNKATLTQRIEAKKLADAEAAKKAAEDAAAKKAAEEAAAVAAAQKKVVTAPKPVTSGKSITVSAGSAVSYDGYGKVPVSWTSSFAPEKGYKLVWGTSPNPVYPGSSYSYYSKASTSGSGYIKDTPGTTLYVRVCEYLGGSCGVYSNQITVNL